MWRCESEGLPLTEDTKTRQGTRPGSHRERSVQMGKRREGRRHLRRSTSTPMPRFPVLLPPFVRPGLRPSVAHTFATHLLTQVARLPVDAEKGICVCSRYSRSSSVSVRPSCARGAPSPLARIRRRPLLSGPSQFVSPPFPAQGPHGCMRFSMSIKNSCLFY